MTLTVEIPTKLVPLLNERARKEHKEPEALVVEILEEKLAGAQADDEATREEQWRQQMYQEGRLVKMSDELRARIIPGVTHEEVRQTLARAGGKSLSDIVIEQRGPKDWLTTSSTPAPSSKE
jgi:hypothetical protein